LRGGFTARTAFTQSWTYNSREQLKQTMATNQGGSKLLGLTFVYAAGYGAAPLLTESTATNNGNLHHQRIEIGANSRLNSFTYDNADRLASFTDGGKQQNYGYDAYGNMTQLSQSGLLESEQLTAVGTSFFNSSTNQVNGIDYDLAGLPKHEVNNTVRKFAWDAEGRLVRIAPSGGLPEKSYEYDGDGLRVRRVRGSVVTNFLYGADGELLAEFPGITPAVWTPDATLARYLVQARSARRAW